MKCPICRQTKFQTLFVIGETAVQQCSHCGLVYIGSASEDNRYDKSYYRKGGKLKRWLEKIWTELINQNRWNLVRQYRKEGKIMEIGCGTGNFLNIGDSGRWQKTGIEISPWAYQIVQQCPWASYNKTLRELKLSPSRFDVVCAWHVIEHLTVPRRTLQEVNRVLKKDGLFFLSTPNTDSLGFRSAGKSWFHLAPQYHHHLFNSDNIKSLLNQTDFKVIKINFPACEFPFDLWHSLSGVNKLAGFWRKLTAAQNGRSETMMIIAQKQ